MKLAKQFGTHWFTIVMGIGIVAVLTYTSPVHFPFQQPIGISLFWLLNVVFVMAIVFWLVRWIIHSQEAMDDFRHPSRALFYGAFAMGVNVVGNDWLLIGGHIVNHSLVVDISKTVWVVGTVISMFTVIVVPYLLFTEHEVTAKETLASWLIPVVPPIVAAATGVNLIPLWGSPSAQFAMTAIVVAMFGITFFLFIMVSAMVYSRLVYHKRLSGDMVPSLWVEIGPIGMSMATLCTLPVKTQTILGPYISIMHGMALIISMALWGVGIWWIVISGMHSLFHLSKRGDGIPFNLGWWSYVFPIGSFTSGTYALGQLVPYSFFVDAGFVQLIILWACFTVVCIRTASGVANGTLLKWRKLHHASGQHGLRLSPK